MRAGRISPGNGEALQKALFQGEQKRLRSLLVAYRREALNSGAKHVLISNELLINGLTRCESVDEFERMAVVLGYSQIRCLLFLRDPVDQAFSLFRHRAKSGRHGNIKEWLKEGYELPELLQQFLTRMPHKLTVRKYDRSGEVLMKRFFQDWLEIDSPKIERMNQRVNPSLSLSELRMIAEIRQVRPRWVHFFYKKMLDIPIDDKANEEDITKGYLQEIRLRVIESEQVWKIYGQLMPVGEQLNVPEFTFVERGDENLNFTIRQLKVITEFISETGTVSFKVKLVLNRIRNLLAWIKWGIFDILGLS